jgi:hypothetical protein
MAKDGLDTMGRGYDLRGPLAQCSTEVKNETRIQNFKMHPRDWVTRASRSKRYAVCLFNLFQTMLISNHH